MPTPLFVKFQKRIKDAFHDLDVKQLEPWVHFNSGKPVRVKRLDGKDICYEGILFEGSPRQVFWSNYIEPFIEDISINEINEASRQAADRNIDGHALLDEVEMLLFGECDKVFTKMETIDQRLRGRGYPEKVDRKSSHRERESIKGFIHSHISSEKTMFKTKPWYELWYMQNKFIIWFIGILLTVIGIYLNFIT